MTTTPDTSNTVDPRNPAKKYYSGIASMTLAAVSLFILTPIVSVAGVVCGIVAVVSGGKLDNQKLRGEGWLGLIASALIFAVSLMI